MTESPAQATKWAVKKEISIGDVLAIMLAAFAIVTAYFSLDSRVKLIEAAQSKQELIDKAQDAAQSALKHEFAAWLIRIESKLDRLFEGPQKGSGYTNGRKD